MLQASKRKIMTYKVRVRTGFFLFFFKQILKILHILTFHSSHVEKCIFPFLDIWQI